MFMNQYWWRNIDKATKNACFAYPTCPKYNSGEPVHSAPEYLKLCSGPMDHCRFGKWILFSFPHHMDINML